MKSTIYRVITTALMLLSVSCSRIMEEDHIIPAGADIPDGTPITMMLGFGSIDQVELHIGTKAEASIVEETRVNDIYVLIFNNDTGEKIYGRYFGYDHRRNSLAELNSYHYEGWYVENKSITDTEVETKGAVKISTTACSDAKVVVIANVRNSALTLNGDSDGIAYLNHIDTWGELYETQVILSQDVVARNDVFMKVGTLDGVSTAEMTWGTLPDTYDNNYKVSLRSLDAKVKVRVKINPDNIEYMDAVYWHAYNIPDRCWLFAHIGEGGIHEKPVDSHYFDTEEVYFDGTEPGGWSIFTFYMLENCHTPSKMASTFYEREKKTKEDLPVADYGSYTWTTGTPPSEMEHSGAYVRNKEWEFANDHATYVDFDLVLTLTEDGIYNATGERVNNALTTDAVYTMHLGDFGNSAGTGTYDFNNYETLRNHAYTYDITVNNSESIFVEVQHDEERQASQEGSLLLTSDEIVNADCHYESHSIAFQYNGDLSSAGLTWFVKTPFSSGQPKFNTTTRTFYDYDNLDYQWVKYAINDEEGGRYTTARQKYPGKDAYSKEWLPTADANSGYVPNQLLDINQLILLLYDQSTKHGMDGNLYRTEGESDYIRVTAFIDEYYYEVNPFTGEVDPDLWRRFVNAKPREMHILSDARYSRDRQSDVIKSSHSIIQASIQTIYNLYAPGLRTLWGTEHKDEIKEKSGGWTLWPDGGADASSAGPPEKRISNSGAVGRRFGRLNSAYTWGLLSRGDNNPSAVEIDTVTWNKFLNYEVDNNTPELRDTYHGMIYSCLARNRDNNGDGVIDRNELRWYLASSEQLTGMFVGNEALSLSARLFQPAEGEWRAHIISSTSGNFRALWAEEGAAFGPYNKENAPGKPEYTWADWVTAAHGESVRCLRDIGTYDVGGVVKDISDSPYNQPIDEYYTVEVSGTGENTRYTFDFDRLNSKCIREYSAAELPYHDQMSMNNRLYAKMVTQTKAEAVAAFNVKHEVINPEIAAGSDNKYCPPGYRFPNMSESLMMYNSISETGNFYTANTNHPTRTYYDRGAFGALRSTTEPWKTEIVKIGWTISSDGSIHANDNVDIKAARCVRDENMTGSIEGEVLLADEALYAGDWSEVILNFSSRASALSYASLKLCYTNHAGNYREIDIPIENPTGTQYREPLNVTIPSLSSLGLVSSDLPRNAVLRAEVHNAAGMSYITSHDAVIQQVLHKTRVELPAVYDNDKGLPIRANLIVGGHNSTLASATLRWRESGGEWQDHALTVDSESRSQLLDVYIKDLLGSAVYADQSQWLNKKYEYYIHATASDESVFDSPVRYMTVTHVNYTPNPAPVGGWTSSNTVAVISVTWDDTITGLDFTAGDRIDVLMDLSNCFYVYKDGNKDHDLGLDNIFGISSDNLNNITNTIILYYPAQEILVAPPANQGNAQLLLHAGGWGKTGDKYPSASYPLANISTLRFSLDKEGMYLNGSLYTTNFGNWNTVKPTLLSQTSLHVGSVEGAHKSRATYNYIRVIR